MLGSPGSQNTTEALPDWLLSDEAYQPLADRDGFIAGSMRSIAGVLAHFRLDVGRKGKWSASAPAKLLFCLGCILMTSLSTNFFFVLVMLACVLIKMATLPAESLRRVMSLSVLAALMSALLMLPAVLLGSYHSSVTIGVKVLVSVALALCVTLSTPFHELTAALRVFRVPNLFILTIDLALKNIVSLGQVALEVLTALQLRSVGKNQQKGQSLGGVGGVLFLKSQVEAEQTYASMNCRGFEGEYALPAQRPWKRIDAAWLVVFVALLVLFLVLEGLL